MINQPDAPGGGGGAELVTGVISGSVYPSSPFWYLGENNEVKQLTAPGTISVVKNSMLTGLVNTNDGKTIYYNTAGGCEKIFEWQTDTDYFAGYAAALLVTDDFTIHRFW